MNIHLNNLIVQTKRKISFKFFSRCSRLVCGLIQIKISKNPLVILALFANFEAKRSADSSKTKKKLTEMFSK